MRLKADTNGLPEEFAGLALPIEQVDVEQTWVWLRRGWQDLVRSKEVSLTFGVAIAAVSALIFYGFWKIELMPYAFPAAAGFMFLAPLLAVAFYDISRRLELGQPVDLMQVAMAWKANPGGIFTMGLVMMMFHLAWERVAMLLYPLFFGAGHPVNWSLFLQSILFTMEGIPFLLVGTAIGGVLATIAFAISVVSFPMLLDRNCSVPRAIATSVLATIVNWRVLLGWAALILLFTAAGIVTFGLGLVITMPLIGHASWHAYRDLVTPPR